MKDEQIFLYRVVTAVMLFLFFFSMLLLTFGLDKINLYYSLLFPLIIAVITIFFLKLFLKKRTFNYFFNGVKIIFIYYLLISVIIIFTYLIINLKIFILNIILINLFFLTGIYIIWRIYGRDFRPNELNYFKNLESEPPEKIDPIIANYFITTDFSKNWFSSAILYLVWKKVYHLERKSSDYVLKINNKNNLKESLPFYVSKTFKFLKEQYNENEVSFKDLKRKICDPRKTSDFLVNYYTLEFNIKKYYEDFLTKNNYFSYTGVYFYTSYIFFSYFIFFILANEISFWYFVLPLIVGFLSILNLNKTIILLGRFTKKGAILHYKWENYKKYLETHSNMHEKGILEVNLWDYHLIYAATFNLTNKIKNKFNNFLTR